MKRHTCRSALAAMAVGAATLTPASAAVAAQTASVLSVTPSRVNFGLVPTGDTAWSDVVITNNGTDALTLNSTGFTRSSTGLTTDYINSTCYWNGLPAGGTCTVRFTFTPTSQGGAWNVANVVFVVLATDSYVTSPSVRLQGVGK